MQLQDLDLSGTYSYADYYSWTFDERVELINGKIFDMGSSPGTLHQLLSGFISYSLANYVEGRSIEVFFAPFDVRLPKSSIDDNDVFTVLQPDICVICDPNKIDERGCIGAPDIVVEILIKGNNSKDLKNKFEAYEAAGVKEYWIIFPYSKSFLKCVLLKGQYKLSRLQTFGDEVTTTILPGFTMSLDELFEIEIPT
ncbi:MAG: Uma2 family endonuclease [Sphingobacteriales bacterium]